MKDTAIEPMIEPNTQTVPATAALLTRLNIPYSYTSLKDDLETHPDYPSLYSIYHLLDRYGLPTQAVQAEPKHLEEWKAPYLVRMQMPGAGTDFACVVSRSNGTVTIKANKGNQQNLPLDVFVKRWDGIALLPQHAGNAAQPEVATHLANDKLQRKKNRAIAAVCIASILLALVIMIWQHPLAAFILIPWMLIKLVGISVAVLLLMYEVNRKSETVKQFCTAGKEVNCDAVLQSSGAKVGHVSWSIAGFSWMMTGLLALLTGANGTLLAAGMALLALPYMFYSVYYQWRVVRQWCLLCLAVQVTLLAEATWVFVTYKTGAITLTDHTQLVNSALIALAGIGLLITGWIWLEPMLKQGVRMPGWRAAYKRLMNNRDVFFAMLQRQERAPEGYKECSLLFGDPNAKYEILKVCNPYCGPCNRSHLMLEKILQKNKEICVRIIFHRANEVGDLSKVAHFFNAFYRKRGEKETKGVMHIWYTDQNKDLISLQKKYPEVDAVHTEEIRNRMNIWCTSVPILKTPTIFVNGKMLPVNYRWGDLIKIFDQ